MEESPSGSLMPRLEGGDPRAAREVFDRYTERLIALARQRLPAALSPRLDPEDVVQSVYRSFFAAVRDGRYSFQHGIDLWRLLTTITLNKLFHQVKRNTRGKRSVKREAHSHPDPDPGLETRLLSGEPSPVEAVMLTEQLEQVFQQLGPRERRILELRLQGHMLEDIAQLTQRSERTVRRTLDEVKLLLEKWKTGS
jgi:RNA polymerase sigma-70 factor, ECF subfamily